MVQNIILNLHYIDCLYDVIYEAENALSKFNNYHYLQLTRPHLIFEFDTTLKTWFGFMYYLINSNSILNKIYVIKSEHSFKIN